MENGLIAIEETPENVIFAGNAENMVLESVSDEDERLNSQNMHIVSQ